MVSKKWIKKLFAETRQWVSEGIIDADQEARIQNRYSGHIEYKRLINTIVTLGSVLIGLGILLFVASNWQELSRPVKVGIIFSVISLFNLCGYYFRYVKNEYPGLGEGLLLMGAFSFGAGVWLIAQIYQIHYNFSAGLIFWILGILPIILVFRSWTILALSSILSIAWLFSYHSYYFKRDAYGFFPLLAVLLGLVYLLKQRFSLFVMIVATAVWLGHFWIKYTSLFEFLGVFTPHLILTIIYAVFGFILYGLGIWHENRSRLVNFSFLYKLIGMLFISLSTYSLTFTHHYYPRAFDTHRAIPALIFLIGVLLVLVVVIFYRLQRLAVRDDEKKEIRFIHYIFVAQLAAFLLSLYVPKSASLSYNLLLLGEVLVFMYLGFLKHNEGIFRLAIIIFFLDILSRYFDIFWKMLPRSLLFILGGLLLIAGAIFANNKRLEIEKKMRQDAVQ